MSMHVYTFANMNGKQYQVTSSSELGADLISEYKKVLGIACTHTEEPMGNDIVPPSREYDAAAAHIGAQHELIKQLQVELDQMTARCAELERWADQVLNDEYATGDEKKKAADVLRPDAVSLSAIKADALINWINMYTNYTNSEDTVNMECLMDHVTAAAAALREEKS